MVRELIRKEDFCNRLLGFFVVDLFADEPDSIESTRWIIADDRPLVVSFSTFIFLFSSNCVLQVATQQQSVTMSQIYSGVGGGRALESNDREVHVLQLSTVCAAHCGHGVLQETRVGELALLTKGGSNSESGTSVPARFRLWLFFFSAAKGTLPRSPTHLFPDPVHCRKWRSSSFLASLQLFAFLHAYHHFFRLPHIRLPVTPSDPACSNMHMERQVEKG
jgi:hypothetical protein